MTSFVLYPRIKTCSKGILCCCRREVKQKTAEAKSTGSKAVLSGGKTSRPCNMDAVSEANDTFALSLLKMLCEDNASGNVFFSPLSISSALAMVFLGAKGNTAAQMSQVFSLNTEKDVHVGFQSLLAEMNKPSTQYLLRSANRIFAEKTCEFFSTFKELCLRSCNAELEQLPFAKDAEKSRKHINTWVSEMTEGKIQNLLPANSIDEETRLIVVNAVYFKGRWSEPFKKTCTKEMPFKINQKEQRPVQMMVQNATFNLAYIEEVKAQVLELPYEGKELSMLILLPDHNVDLSLVEKELTLEKLIAWTKPNRMWRTEVEVFLPRFKLEEHYAMESVLQRLGIVDAFQVDKADFSAMSAEKYLCLSKFVHKALVEVNEEGTEAAAATFSLIVWGCAQYVRKMFCADHPFLFFIRHNKANCILFCGKFSSP